MLVDETADGDGLNSLRMREADLNKHLGNDRDPAAEAAEQKALAARRDSLEEEQRLIALAKKAKPIEFGSKDDFQLAQALNHFKGLPVQLSKAEPKEAPGAEAASRSDKADGKLEIKPDSKPDSKPGNNPGNKPGSKPSDKPVQQPLPKPEATAPKQPQPVQP